MAEETGAARPAAALVYAVGSIGCGVIADIGTHEMREQHALEAACWEGGRSVERLVAAHVLPPRVSDLEIPPRPDLAAIGVRSCACCGCTDEYGCPGGCSWIGPRLCSACAGDGAPGDG